MLVSIVAALAAGAAGLAAQPPSPSGLRLTGDAAWEAGDLRRAFTAYDELVRIDSAATPTALLRLGTLHGMAGRTREAIACHARYVADRPRDAEGRSALGRSLALAYRFAAATAQYDTALVIAPASRAANIGRATVLAWSGRVDPAIAILEARQRADPTDAFALVQRARFLLWRGQTGKVRQLADSLMSWKAPESLTSDALEGWSWVEAEVAPAVSSRITMSTDAEQNHLLAFEARARFAPPGVLRYEILARTRRVEATGSAIPALLLPGASLATTWQAPGARHSLRLELGGIDYRGTAARTSALTGGVEFARPLGEGSMIRATVSRTGFDDLARTADRGLVLEGFRVDLSHPLRPTLALSLAGGYGQVSGEGDPNRRAHTEVDLRWSPRRSTAIGLSLREQSWSRGAPGLYFAPERLFLGELSAHLERPRDFGYFAAIDVGVASQGARLAGSGATSSVVPRAALRIGWRTAPGREVIGSYDWGKGAAVGTQQVDGYWSQTATVAVRWTF